MCQGSSGGGEGFEVTKFGHGRVALIGFPRFSISRTYTLAVKICQCLASLKQFDSFHLSLDEIYVMACHGAGHQTWELWLLTAKLCC